MADQVQHHNNTQAALNRDGNEGRKLYSCKTCDMQFSCFQALGGHQNGHKTDRVGQIQAHHAQPYNAQSSLYSRVQSMPIPYHHYGNPLLNYQNLRITSVGNYGHYQSNYLNRYQRHNFFAKPSLVSNKPGLPWAISNHGLSRIFQPKVNVPEPAKAPPRLFGVPLCPVVKDEDKSKMFYSGKRKCIDEADEERLNHCRKFPHHVEGSSSDKKQKGQIEIGTSIHQTGAEELMKWNKSTCGQLNEEFIGRIKTFDKKVEPSTSENQKIAEERGESTEENEEFLKWKKKFCSLINGFSSSEDQKNACENENDLPYSGDGECVKSEQNFLGQIDGSSSGADQTNAPKDEKDDEEKEDEAFLKWKRNLFLEMDGSSSGENK